MPQDLKALNEYTKKFPEKKFIKKHKTHAGIFPMLPKNFHKAPNSSFIQEVIGPPFLVEGYKFDLSKHVIITSVDPLR